MTELFARDRWVIQQKTELGESLLGFESRNRYAILDEAGSDLGSIAEEGSGLGEFLKRMFLRSHRPFTAQVLDAGRQPLLRIRRPWHWAFSSTFIETPDGRQLGAAHRRWRWFSRRYDLVGSAGQPLGFVHAGPFRVWKFDLLDPREAPMGEITKQWGGLLKEAFTDADTFLVALSGQGLSMSAADRAVILGAAIALDFDFFEDNQRR